MTDDPSKRDEHTLPGLGDIVGDLDGIPLPPAIKKSLWKSLGRLIGSVTDLGTAWVDAKADAIKTTAEARRIAKLDIAKKVAGMIEADEQLAARAVNFIGHEMIREQTIRERVAGYAVEDLRSDPPRDDVKDVIEDDWLSAFMKDASTKSSEEMQLLFGRILAGEIRQPGSFSLRSVRTLGLIDKNTANLFEKLCNTSIHVSPLGIVMTISSGHAGNNALQEFGLSFDKLNILHESGLIIADYNAWRDLSFLPLTKLPFDLGGQTVWFQLKDETEKEQLKRVNGVMFSSVGAELRKIVSKKPMDIYAKYLADFAAKNNCELLQAVGRFPDGRIAGRPVKANS